MAKAGPRWKRELPRRLPPRRGPEGCQRQPSAALRGESRRSRLRPAQVSGDGTRRPGRCTPQPTAPAPGLSPRPNFACQAASTHFATPSPQAMPGDGHQVQPGTSMRSSASDDPHRSVVGRSGRLGAQSHLICMPQDADRHDAAIGADRRFSRTGLQQNQSLYVTTDWADVLRADSGLVADGILGGFGMCRTAVPQGVGEAGSGISAATAGNQRGPRRQWVLFLVASAGWGVGGSAGRRSSAGPACGSCGVGHAGPAPL
jgi:hypothetical protein